MKYIIDKIFLIFIHHEYLLKEHVIALFLDQYDLSMRYATICIYMHPLVGNGRTLIDKFRIIKISRHELLFPLEYQHIWICSQYNGLMYHTKRSDVDSSNVLLLVQILSAMYHHLYSYTSYIRTLETEANIWPWLCNYIPYFFMRCNPLVMPSIPVSVVMIQIFAVCADITLFYERKDQPYLWWYNDGVEFIKTNHTVSIPAKSILCRYFWQVCVHQLRRR